MPLQNRVTPDGSIIADAARGSLMGNRGGEMHDGSRRLTGRRWVSKAWIACVLQYKGRHEVIMAPGHYTQLFFLDEATALAAGHRPCALCRRADWLRFMAGWQEVHGLATQPKVADVDAVLQTERVGVDKCKETYTARLADLPSGVMVSTDPASPPPLRGRNTVGGSALGDVASLFRTTPTLALPPQGGGDKWSREVSLTPAALYLNGALYPWTPSGYLPPIEAPTTVHVLTPRSIVAILAAGYAPMLHPTARSMSAAKSV